MENVNEYKDGSGEIDLKITIDKNEVILQGQGDHEIMISDVQARWLASALHEHFGGGPSADRETDRILFLTGEITEETVVDWQQELLRMSYREAQFAPEDRSPIIIFINTPGGYALDGLALIDTIEYIRGMGLSVYGVVQGTAFSMGSILLQACTLRLVARHGRVMVHSVRAGVCGSVEEMKAELAEIDFINSVMGDIFAERNTAGNKDPKFWLEFAHGTDKYLGAKECIALGLADAEYNPLQQWDMREYEAALPK